MGQPIEGNGKGYPMLESPLSEYCCVIKTSCQDSSASVGRLLRLGIATTRSVLGQCFLVYLNF